MRWALLGVAGLGFASLWGVGLEHVLFAAFLVMFTNFATFCVLYDRPEDRARMRVTEQLRRLHPNTDAAQRLATATIAPTAADRDLGFGPMTLLNLATGIAGAGFLVWGILLRLL